jgi:hypothetical protein
MTDFIKDPDAVLDYAVDWSSWLGTDTIATSTWIVPTGLTKVSDTKTSTSAIIELSGGVKGTTYRVTNRITTANALTDDRTITITCQNK